MNLDNHERSASLHWQSQLVLLLVVPLAAVFVLLEAIRFPEATGHWPHSSAPVAQGLAIGAAFALKLVIH